MSTLCLPHCGNGNSFHTNSANWLARSVKKKTWFLFLIQTLVENSAESLIRTALNENAYQYRKKKLNGYDNPSYVTTKIVKETDRAI